MLAGFDFSLGGLAWLILVVAALLSRRSRSALVNVIEELPGLIQRLRRVKGWGVEADIDRAAELESPLPAPPQQTGRSLEDLLNVELTQEGASVLRTLWEHENQHFPQGGRTWLMFVPEDSPVKPQWNRGLFNTLVLAYTGMFNQSFVGMTEEGRTRAAELSREQPELWRNARDLYYNGRPFTESR